MKDNNETAKKAAAALAILGGTSTALGYFGKDTPTIHKEVKLLKKAGPIILATSAIPAGYVAYQHYKNKKKK